MNEEKKKQNEEEEALSAPAEEEVTEAEESEAKEEEADAPASPFSAEASEALAHLLSVMNEKDKAMLLALFARLAGGREKKRAEEEACLSAMAGEEAFYDLRERAPEMAALIKETPWLQALPLREQLETACYICRGRGTHAPTPEEKLEAVLSDPALLRVLAERQAKLRAAQAATLPPLTHGGRAPALVKEAPKSLTEAKREAGRYLRAYR